MVDEGERGSRRQHYQRHVFYFEHGSKASKFSHLAVNNRRAKPASHVQDRSSALLPRETDRSTAWHAWPAPRCAIPKTYWHRSPVNSVESDRNRASRSLTLAPSCPPVRSCAGSPLLASLMHGTRRGDAVYLGCQDPRFEPGSSPRVTGPAGRQGAGVYWNREAPCPPVASPARTEL